jgi:hypothetical protein
MLWGLVECTGSMESGKKYASNGILEVALLDKFRTRICNWGSSSCKS